MGLDRLRKQIEKDYGKGIITYTSKDNIKKVSVIPTSSINLNNALGVGGVPRGRVSEVFGSDATGKSTLIYTCLKKCSELGEKSVFIDVEHAFDYDYASKIGVKVGELEEPNTTTVIQPDYGEQALEIVQMLVNSKEVALVAVDSVASLVPKAELEGAMVDETIGLQARLISKALRKLTGIISKTNTAVVFINQIREKVNKMGFGKKTDSSGGRALKFYASIRIELKRIKTLKQGDESIGSRIKAQVVKNKVAPPFKISHFEIYNDTGLSESSDIIDLAENLNIIKKSGAWYSYKGENIAQGKEKLRKLLDTDKKLREELEKQVLESNKDE